MNVWDLIAAGCYLMLTLGCWKRIDIAVVLGRDSVAVVLYICAAALTLLPLIHLLQ